MYCPYPVAHSVRRGDTLYQIASHYRTTVQSLLLQNPGVDPYNLQIGATLFICPGVDDAGAPQSRMPVADTGPSMRQLLSQDMRLVWEQHVFWTRLVLISIAERLKDQDATVARLMRNPQDIANIFARYYGANDAKAIEQLLTEHLQIGGDLITALRDGKTEEAEELTKKWYANADQMADTFAGINPYYDRDALQKMLYRHLDLTTNEVKARLAGQYADDVKAFDIVEQEALMMADYFTCGIINSVR